MKFLQALCNIILFILFTICFCMTGYVYAVKFVNEYFNRNEVIVPNIIETQYSRIKKIVPDQYHLNIKVKSEKYSKTVEKGAIIDQDPVPNSFVKPGRAIEVILSKGIKKVECVNIVGLNLRKAQITLKNCGFDIGLKTYVYNKNKKYGTVIAQYPKALQKVEENRSVNLLVSKGKKEMSFILPDLRGYKYSEIKLLIKKMGLMIGKVNYEDLDEYESGTIIKHYPKQGSYIKENSLIDLVVNLDNSRKNSKRKFQTISFELPDGKEKIAVKIILSDNKGVREVYRKEHEPNDKIEHVIGYFGKAKIIIYFNNKKYTELEYN